MNPHAWKDRITWKPEIAGGKPCVRSKGVLGFLRRWIPIDRIHELRARGMRADQVSRSLNVEPEDIDAAERFADLRTGLPDSPTAGDRRPWYERIP